jgi:hypothetical protein
MEFMAGRSCDATAAELEYEGASPCGIQPDFICFSQVVVELKALKS